MEILGKLPKFIKLTQTIEGSKPHTWYYTLNFRIELGEYSTDTGEQDETDRKWIASYRGYDSFDYDIRGEDKNLFEAADKLLEALNKHMPEFIESYKESNIEIVIG